MTDKLCKNCQFGWEDGTPAPDCPLRLWLYNGLNFRGSTIDCVLYENDNDYTDLKPPDCANCFKERLP